MTEQPTLPAGARRRVVVVAADAAVLARQRTPLLTAITARGHKLHCLVGETDEAASASLAALGAEVETFDLGPPQLRAYGDRRVFDAVAARLLAWKPYAVLGIGLKPMVAAALASRRAPAGRVVLVASSLEALGGNKGERPGLAVRWLMRRALRSADALVVYNGEHRQRLAALSILPEELEISIQPGAGVDLAAYEPMGMPDTARGLTFGLVSRPDRAGDIADFAEAARLATARMLPARFVMVPLPVGPGVAGAHASAARLPVGIEVIEPRGGLADGLAGCHVVVQLSDADGFSHEAAEALACGRPVITIDAAGCREAIDERVNGVLVPPHDPVALACAMESFLRRPDQLDWMGRASRRKAERRFDANPISQELLGLMGLTG